MAKRTEVLVARFWRHIGYISLVTAVIWTIVAVWGAWTNKTKTEIKPEIIAPLNPVIETQALEQLKARVETETLTQGFVPEVPASDSANPGL